MVEVNRQETPTLTVDEFGNLKSGDDGDFVLGGVATENESDIRR